MLSRELPALQTPPRPAPPRPNRMAAKLALWQRLGRVWAGVKQNGEPYTGLYSSALSAWARGVEPEAARGGAWRGVAGRGGAWWSPCGS